MTTLAKNQQKKFVEVYHENGTEYTITATVRYDDNCNNGHNTFSITGMIDRNGYHEVSGCIHGEIAKHFPQLRPYIKWHLTSTDGPMHYVANSLYWAGKSGWTNGRVDDPPSLKYFRSAAVWLNATQNDMKSVKEQTLQARLGQLMDEFKVAIESLGFVY